MTKKSIQSIASYLDLVEERKKIFQKTGDPNDFEILNILATNFFEYIKWFECCSKEEKQSYIIRLEEGQFDRYITDNSFINEIKKNGYSKTIAKEWNKFKLVQFLRKIVKVVINY